MNKFLLLSLLVYGLIVAGLATLQGGILLLALPLLLYLAAGLVYRPDGWQLEIERDLSRDHISPSQPVTVTVTITNQGPALEELYLEELIPPGLSLLEGETDLLTGLASGETASLTYTLTGPRGSYRFPGLRARASDRFHLFSRQAIFPATSQLLVLPEVIRLRRAEIRPQQTRIYAGLIPTAQGGPGVEFFGVREYQAGDPLRWINSRATARHQQAIFINEFQQERMADIGLILDAREPSNFSGPAGSLFEYGVQATAALASTFLEANNRVGLFIYGNTLNWTYPGYGKVQRQRILWALAKARAGDSEIFARLDHLPTRLFPTRSQLVFISPLQPEDLEILTRLRARGYHLLVVSPDPVSFEAQGLKPSEATRLAIRLAQLERSLLLNQLRRADIRVLDWPVEIPFAEVAHPILNRVVRR
jgi:uncharacterized protein (DUF58 family)